MNDFSEIESPPTADSMLTSAHVQLGPPIDPLTRVFTYNSDEWEKFIHEWVSCLKGDYSKILRFTGSGDKGVDVAGFGDEKLLKGVWDNYQCKHYNKPVAPHNAWPEIGKILWYSFNQDYAPPRAYYFLAPKETSTKLTQLLANTPKLKSALIETWDKSVRDKITSVQAVPLEGEFADHVHQFDFSIFKPKSIREVIELHRKSPYFVPRFGGGLPARPKPQAPPDVIEPNESLYVAKLLEAYADHKKEAVLKACDLKKWRTLEQHFRRSREAFYHAEALRVFVRDKVEPGTFESLQEEIYNGVIDTHDAPHRDGYECVVDVTNLAQSLALDAHPLAPSTFPGDRRGICHQLANEDRLTWKK